MVETEVSDSFQISSVPYVYCLRSLRLNRFFGSGEPWEVIWYKINILYIEKRKYSFNSDSLHFTERVNVSMIFSDLDLVQNVV